MHVYLFIGEFIWYQISVRIQIYFGNKIRNIIFKFRYKNKLNKYYADVSGKHFTQSKVNMYIYFLLWCKSLGNITTIFINSLYKFKIKHYYINTPFYVT